MAINIFLLQSAYLLLSTVYTFDHVVYCTLHLTVLSTVRTFDRVVYCTLLLTVLSTVHTFDCDMESRQIQLVISKQCTHKKINEKHRHAHIASVWVSSSSDVRRIYRNALIIQTVCTQLLSLHLYPKYFYLHDAHLVKCIENSILASIQRGLELAVKKP